MAEIAQISPMNPPTNASAPAAPAVSSTAVPAPGQKTPGAPQAGKPGEKPQGSDTVPAEPKVSNKLQVLVRREKAALEREQAAKSKEAQALEREKALESREARIKEFETLKDTQPLKALELLGLDLNGLAEVTLNDGNLTPDAKIAKLQQTIEGMKKTSEEEKRQAAESEKQRAEQNEAKAIADFQTEIQNHLGANAKDYELIQFEGNWQAVFDVIGAHYERTIDPKTGIGKVMSIKEAADKVEKFLETKYDKVLGLEKFKGKVAPAAPSKTPVKPQSAPSHKPQASTLNNSMTPGTAQVPTGLLTDEQRIAKAIAFAQSLRAKS